MKNYIFKKEIKEKEGKIYYSGINLEEVANKYKTPLKITFLDIIKDHILSLKQCFDDVIKEENYEGKFIYLNANKANYGALELKEAVMYSDGLETSSYLDLVLSKELIGKNSNKMLFSNGYKDENYLNEIIKTNKDDIDYTCIIDSIEEYEYLKQNASNLKIGLRLHLKALYLEADEVVKDDRFGLREDEIEYILNDLKNVKNLTLTTIHFHQRGFEFEEDKFIENIKKGLEYYIKAKKKYPSLINFDIGGGTPLPTCTDFDYKKWAKLLITFIKNICLANNISMPNIISENGKYSMKDSTINIYSVVGIKNTGDYPWYIVDGSLLIALPEMYALGEEIKVLPINNLNEKMVKARLAGITCDCDDIYYEKNGYINMPNKSNNVQYIACLGTGSYQNSMNGKGGVHHCLLPEEKDLVIYTSDNKIKCMVRHDLQSYEEIKKIINFDLKKH